MRPRVLRILRGRLPAAGFERFAATVRHDVLRSSALPEGLETSALGIRDEGDELAVLTVSVWRDETTLAAAAREEAPSRAFDALLDLVSFEPPRRFDVVIADWPTRGPIGAGAIGLVDVTVSAADEGAVHELIVRQQGALRAEGIVRAFFVGRAVSGDEVEIVAVALWPDRDALGSFLAGRPEGPGIDHRLRDLSRTLRFEVVDLVDPAAPVPKLRVPAALALDGDRNIVDVSPGVARHLGAPPEELLGRRFDDLLTTAEAADLETRWSALLHDGTDGPVVSIRRADGDELPMRVRSIANVPSPGLHAVLLESPASRPSADPEALVRRSLGWWAATPAAPVTQRRPARRRQLPRLITMPSTDRLFGRFTALMLGTFDTPSIRRLQLHLRSVYPHAVVHRREISSEEETWYVFRDGRVGPPPPPEEWWRREGVAQVELDRDGRVVEANAEAGALLRSRSGGRDLRGFEMFEAQDDVALLFGLAFEERASESSVRLFTAGADPLDVRFHAERSGVHLRLALAPLDAAPDDAGRDWFAPLCLPPSDEDFVARTEELCTRLAARHAGEVAGELETRLRVRYPNAVVTPLGRLTGFGPRTHAVLVHRDGEPDDAERWWTLPDAARVRVERGRYVDANEAAVELHGVSRDELLASPLGRFRMSGDERLLMRDVLNRTGSLHTTTRLERGDGRAIDIEFHATLLSAEPQVVEIALRRARVPGTASAVDGLETTA